eukprot:Selendium_serpulae@DN4620_c0_g1_i1.p1
MPGLFTEYCGMDIGKWRGSGVPRSTLDAACKAHDDAYVQMLESGQNPYFSKNKADETFLKTLHEVSPERAGDWIIQNAAKLFFEAKQKILEIEDKLLTRSDDATSALPSDSRDPVSQTCNAADFKLDGDVPQTHPSVQLDRSNRSAHSDDPDRQSCDL